MIDRRGLVALIGIAGLFAAGLFVFASARDRQEPVAPKPKPFVRSPEIAEPDRRTSAVIPTSAFVPTEDLIRAAEAAESLSRFGLPEGERPIAGIVNHHALAADLMAAFLRDLKESTPDLKRVIILSPDHFMAGEGISTSHASYASAFGTIRSDEGLTDLLLREGIASLRTDVFENEHGVGALAALMTRMLPDVAIVPIAVRMDKPVATEPLTTFLRAEIGREGTFVVLSADMSHDLPLEDVSARDAQTKQWLASCDQATLESATDANIDSGKTAALLCEAFADSAPAFRVTGQKVSTDYGGDALNTTSYLTGFWTILKDRTDPATSTR